MVWAVNRVSAARKQVTMGVVTSKIESCTKLAEWELCKDAEGIRTYKKDVPGSPCYYIKLMGMR